MGDGGHRTPRSLLDNFYTVPSQPREIARCGRTRSLSNSYTVPHMKFRVWSEESEVAASAEKAEARETRAAARVHFGDERDDRGVTHGGGRGRPRAGCEEDEGVEDFGVEAGGVGERGVTALDRGGEAREERGIVGDVAAEMREAERDVARFVLGREAGDVTRACVGRVIADEPEEREEAAFAEDGEQEARDCEVGLVEQGRERRLATRGGEAERRAA